MQGANKYMYCTGYIREGVQWVYRVHAMDARMQSLWSMDTSVEICDSLVGLLHIGTITCICLCFGALDKTYRVLRDRENVE